MIYGNSGYDIITSRSRNPKIAAFLKDYDYVKEYGEGVDRMCRELEAIEESREPMASEEWKEKQPYRYEGFLETPVYRIIKMKRT